MDWVRYLDAPDFETSPRKVEKFVPPDEEKSSMHIFNDMLSHEFDLPQFDFINEARREYMTFGEEGFLPRPYFYANPEAIRKIFTRLINSNRYSV